VSALVADCRTGTVFERAMGQAERYRDLRARGDMALAQQCRQTIDELVGESWDGTWQLPRPVAVAMGRPELGPLYAIRVMRADGSSTCWGGPHVSWHFGRVAAEAALVAARRQHIGFSVTLVDGRDGREVRP
jgi:hypothetical protein